jgi:hypothetical protein
LPQRDFVADWSIGMKANDTEREKVRPELNRIINRLHELRDAIVFGEPSLEEASEAVDAINKGADIAKFIKALETGEDPKGIVHEMPQPSPPKAEPPFPEDLRNEILAFLPRLPPETPRVAECRENVLRTRCRVEDLDRILDVLGSVRNSWAFDYL